MSGARSGRARHAALLCGLLAPLAALYAWLDVHGGLGSLKGDGLIYLSTARHWAPYWPADPIAATWASLSEFPPLYPALLAATGGAADLRLAHGVTVLCLILGFAAFYGWLVGLGVARARAALAVAVLALAPGTVLQSFHVHPEGLSVALVFAALALLALAERSGRAAWYWTAAVAVGLAILARTVGVALLPALLLVLVRARPRGWPAIAALALAPGALWAVLHDVPSGYGDSLAGHYADASPGAIARSIGASIAATASGLAGNLSQSPRLAALVLAFGALALALAAWRFVRGRADAWYALAYLAVLALWPFPQEAPRLAWVVVPFVLAYLAWGAERVAARLPGDLSRLRPAVAWAPLAVLALVVLPEFLLLAARATHPLAREQPAVRHVPQWYHPDLATAAWNARLHLGTVEALERFGPGIPEGECLFTTLPLVAGFYARREALPPPAESMDPADFDDALRGAGCRFVLFTELSGRSGSEAPFYPLERLGGRVEIVDEHVVTLPDGRQRRVALLGALAGP